MIESKLQQYWQKQSCRPTGLVAVLFDMDGVLYDSMKAHAKSWQQTMVEQGFETTSADEFYLHEGRTANSTITLLYERELHRKPTPEEVKRIYERKTELFRQNDTGLPVPGASDVIRWVKQQGLNPVLVTGSGQPTLLSRLNHTFPDTFDSENMVTAYDVNQGKPHPEPFLKGLRKGGNLLPTQAIVIENAPLGVEAASSAGIFTIAVNTGPLSDEVLYQAGANLVLPDMATLLDVLPTVEEAFR